MTAPEEGPAVPLLADALEELMKELITVAHVVRDLAEEPGALPEDVASHMAAYRVRSHLAYRLSLLIDQYRKGKLA